jgi:hypothetical protein
MFALSNTTAPAENFERGEVSWSRSANSVINIWTMPQIGLRLSGRAI